MIGYALLTALKLQHGFRVFMETQHLEHLSYYFKNIDKVESLDVLCEEGQFYPWMNVTDSLQILLNGTFDTGKCIDYLNNVRFLFYFGISFFSVYEMLYFLTWQFQPVFQKEIIKCLRPAPRTYNFWQGTEIRRYLIACRLIWS